MASFITRFLMPKTTLIENIRYAQKRKLQGYPTHRQFPYDDYLLMGIFAGTAFTVVQFASTAYNLIMGIKKED
ncbi:hypothetical protein NDN08_002354 [Rhodosorus marinus]|uniref:Uncharacterized protein n=1 Tax=Rhodosorus marinus TaxID=101924 RepID=A0AAV8UTJ2_9RHOD|nr:hypothetical protein NDN08_002354 [Rhodosorus marinus]